MPRKPLKFEALVELDGGVIKHAMNVAMAAVMTDLDQRPALDKKRKVTLELIYAPLADDTGKLESVDLTFAVKQSIPATGNRPVKLVYKINRETGAFELMYEPDVNDAVDGPTVIDEAERARQEREEAVARAKAMKIAQ